MNFEENLILNRYFLDLLGFETPRDFQEKLRDKEEGFDSDGRSNFLDAIINLRGSKIPEEDLLRYDRAIKEYVEKLRKNRRQLNFNLKYFQYLAVLFSEILFEKYFHHKHEFVNELNQFAEKRGELAFAEEDLDKIAFSMATGSGKTIITHINYWQFLKYSKDKYDNIILVTPNEGMSRQHFKEMRKSGIRCKVYRGDVGNIRTKSGEVLIIDIHKLVEEKRGEGVTVDVSSFEGKNLVFVDEGHKGIKSDDEIWKRRREELASDGGFILEYSATFRQVVGKNKELLKEYGKSILFEYSYKYFYEDQYGKDFYIINLREDRYSNEYTDLLLTANLLSFYEQLLIYQEKKRKLREYKLEKPLLIFVGGTVTGKILKSDIPKIVLFLKRILADKSFLEKNTRTILSGESGLIDENGNDIFSDKFRYLKENGWEIDDVYKRVFGGSGSLQLRRIEKAKGELGLKASTGEKYFGVINVGDVGSLKRVLEDKVKVEKDYFSDSLFFRTGEGDTSINLLMGSRKFMEGWDSWRVSCMGLLNMGRSKGPQIIQLFGRGVRLKGKDFSLKREESPDYSLRKLQTLFIFGLDADYIEEFLKTIKREEINLVMERLPIRFNKKEEWGNELYTIEREKRFDFTENILNFEIDDEILNKKRLKINLRPKITLTRGLETERVETATDESGSLTEYTDLVDWSAIYLKMMDYKIAKGYYNLLIVKDVLREIIESEKYELIAAERQVTPDAFEDIERIERIILTILKSYMDKFYKAREKRQTMDYLKVKRIGEEDENFDFEEFTVKIPLDLIDDVKGVFGDLEKFYEKDIDEIPTIHFDNHLYTPLTVYWEGKEDIKTSPVKLNRGETSFVKDLRGWLSKKEDEIEGSKIFLLRNLSRKGIGFFQKAGGFYPDFIMWIKRDGEQEMVFIDPKGIRNLGNFNDDKIQFCSEGIREVEEKVKEEAEKKGFEEELNLSAFIISVSDYDAIKDNFGEGNHEKEEFEKHNIIFQEKDYIDKIMNKVT